MGMMIMDAGLVHALKVRLVDHQGVGAGVAGGDRGVALVRRDILMGHGPCGRRRQQLEQQQQEQEHQRYWATLVQGQGQG